MPSFPVPSRSILIIEDDREIRNALSDALEIEGYSVEAAANGKEGLELLPRLRPPCLVLLDLMMPVMNGYEFLSIKRKDVILAPIPVVIVSAFSDRGQAEAGDVQGFIKKPVDLDLLFKLVKRYCG